MDDGERSGIDGDHAAQTIVGDGFVRGRWVAVGGRFDRGYVKGVVSGSTSPALLAGGHGIGVAAMAGARAIDQAAPLFSLVRSADVDNHFDRQDDIASVVGDWTVRRQPGHAEPIPAAVGRLRAGIDGAACSVAGPLRLPSSVQGVTEVAPSSGARLCEPAGLAMAGSAFVSVVSDHEMQPGMPVSDPYRALGQAMTAER